MDLKLQVGDFHRPGSDDGARRSSRPPLDCHCSIHIHHSRMSLSKECFTALALLLNIGIHPVQICHLVMRSAM